MDWQLRLTDAMSGPAARAAAALKPVEDKLRDVNKQLASSAIDKMTDGIEKQRAQLRLQRSDLAANLRASRGQERAENQLARASERAKSVAAREERARMRASEGQARVEARAKVAADRFMQKSAQDRARIQEAVRRREVRALAASARQEQAQQRQQLQQQNRLVAAQNAARIKAELRAQKDIERASQGQEQGGGMGAAAMAGGQVGLLMKIAAAALAAAAAVAALGAAFTHAVIDAVAFRQAALGGLTQVMKSASGAKDVFDVGVNLSARWNIDPRETVTQLQDLVSKGFSAKEARVLLTASADLKVMNPNANIAGIMLAIGQIRSKGALQMEELQGQLAEAGINIGKTLEIIGKKTGRTVAQVRKDISAGKVDSNTGIWAIVKSIEDMGGGKLGSVADKASKSINGMLMGLQFRPGLMALKIAEMIEGGAGEGALKGALSRLLAASDPEKSPGMKRLLAGASDLANELLQMLFGPLANAGGAGGLQTILNQTARAVEMVAGAVRTVRPLVQGFLAGFGEGASQVFTVVMMVAQAMGGPFAGKLGGAAGAARLVGKALAWVIGILAGVVVGLVAASASVMGFVNGLFALGAVIIGAVAAALSALSALPGVLLAAGVTMGTNMWTGFVQGIEAGVAAVTDAGTRLADAAKSAVATTLDQHSPSRVMMEMGGYTAQGFAQGVEGGAGQVDAAMTGLVTPPAPVLGKGGGGTTSNTLSAGGVTINITVEGGGSGANPQAIGAETRAAVAAALEDLLAQMGLNPTPTPA